LVGHERLQRRDNQRASRLEKRRQLKAEALSASRRANGEQRLSTKGRQHHVQLTISEALFAEYAQRRKKALAALAEFASSVEHPCDP
jgi:hypothetical protein